MKGNYTHYILCDVSQLTTTITDRYNWDELVEPTYPSDSDLKSDIQAFMDTWSIEYDSGDTKSELLDKIEQAKPVGTKNTNVATIQDLFDRHPRYFAPRYNPDGTKVIFKGDWTLVELKALGSGFSVYTNEEAKAYLSTSADWVQDEE